MKDYEVVQFSRAAGGLKPVLWHRFFHALWIRWFYNSKQQFSPFPLPGIIGLCFRRCCIFQDCQTHTPYEGKGTNERPVEAPQMLLLCLGKGFGPLVQESLLVFQQSEKNYVGNHWDPFFYCKFWVSNLLEMQVNFRNPVGINWQWGQDFGYPDFHTTSCLQNKLFHKVPYLISLDLPHYNSL